MCCCAGCDGLPDETRSNAGSATAGVITKLVGVPAFKWRVTVALAWAPPASSTAPGVVSLKRDGTVIASIIPGYLTPFATVFRVNGGGTFTVELDTAPGATSGYAASITADVVGVLP